ncbi:MAG TPA: hypothetical protein VJB98_03525 [Candidatus Paceibacterota bacterium]
MQTTQIERSQLGALIVALAGIFAFVTIVIADTTTTAVVVGNATPIISVSFNGGNAITLNEASYSYASATVTVTDTNGCATINYVSATAFLASTSGVTKLNTSTNCTADDNNCYPTASTTADIAAVSDTVCMATTTGNQCTGGVDTSVQYDCGFKFWYIAEATDSGAPTWASSMWILAATTSDGVATSTASNTGQTVEINALAALNLTSSLSYNTVTAGGNSGSTNATTTATTTGNIAIDGQIYGNASYMESGPNQIHISRQKYNATPFVYSSAGTRLTSSTTPTLEFTTSEPTATTSDPAQTVSWGTEIDTGQANGTYTGSSTVAAAAD